MGSYLTRYLISSMNAQKDTDRFLLFHSEGSRRLPLFVNEFLCEYFERNVHSKDFLDNCFALIFLELTEVYRKDQRQTADGGDDLLLPILRYLEKNWPTCTLKSTAEAFHMNPNYLSATSAGTRARPSNPFSRRTVCSSPESPEKYKPARHRDLCPAWLCQRLFLL